MIEPIHFWAALRRSWRLLAALALLFAVVAVLLPVSHAVVQKDNPVLWRATSIVGAPPSNGIVGTGNVTLAQIIFFANSFEVKESAISAAKPPGSPVRVFLAMKAAPQAASKSKSGGSGKKNQTGLALLAASGQTKDVAATLCNDWAKALGIKLTAVAAATAATSNKPKSSSGTAASPPTGYQILLPAQPATATRTTSKTSNLTSSRKVRALAGVVIGLLVGAGIVLISQLLNKRLREASRAEAHFKFPVVAEIPEPWPAEVDEGVQPIVVTSDPTSGAAEAYRKLRMSVLFEAMAPAGVPSGAYQEQYADNLLLAPIEPYNAPARGSRSVILVVSPGAEGSRPQVVANLSATFAEAGQRVIVTSAGEIGSGTSAGYEVSHVGAIGTDEIRAQLQPASIENVSMLSLRPFVKNSAQLVGRAGAVFEAARQLADVVIVEAPPFLEVHHGGALVHAVDVVLVVGEYGNTTLDDADQTGVLLRRLGAPVLGVVFTQVPLPKGQRVRRGSSAPAPATIAVPVVEVAQVPGQFPVETQA